MAYHQAHAAARPTVMPRLCRKANHEPAEIGPNTDSHQAPKEHATAPRIPMPRIFAIGTNSMEKNVPMACMQSRQVWAKAKYIYLSHMVTTYKAQFSRQ